MSIGCSVCRVRSVVVSGCCGGLVIGYNGIDGGLNSDDFVDVVDGFAVVVFVVGECKVSFEDLDEEVVVGGKFIGDRLTCICVGS